MLEHIIRFLLVGSVCCAARGSPYWIAYEGNDFPESEGWERHAYGGGAERYF